MKIALALAVYFVISIIVSLGVGRFIAWGTGSDLEHNPTA